MPINSPTPPAEVAVLGRTLVCRGEFDAGNCDLLRNAITRIGADGPGYMVDLTAVTFVDSRVLEVLFTAAPTKPVLAVQADTMLARIVATVGLDAVVEVRVVGTQP